MYAGEKKGKYSDHSVLGKAIAALTATALLLAGCGAAGSAEEKADRDAVVVSAEDADSAEISGVAKTPDAGESAGDAGRLYRKGG